MSRGIVIPNVPNPIIGTTAISDVSGEIVQVTDIIRYNGHGRFTCAFTSTGYFRSTVGNYVPVDNGIWVEAGINVMRTPHYNRSTHAPITLLEDDVLNLIRYSRDLRSGAPHNYWNYVQGSVTETYDQVGLDGTISATRLQATGNNVVTANAGALYDPVGGSYPSRIVWWVKKDTDETRFPYFEADLSLFNGTPQCSRRVWLNTKTGAFVDDPSFNVGSGSTGVYSELLWWVVEIDLTTLSGAAQQRLSCQIAPARGTVLGSFGAATGGVTIGQVEINPNEISGLYTSPIYTNGAIGFRDGDTFTTNVGVMDFYYDKDNAMWKAKEYVPERYRNEEGVLKNM